MRVRIIVEEENSGINVSTERQVAEPPPQIGYGPGNPDMLDKLLSETIAMTRASLEVARTQ